MGDRPAGVGAKAPRPDMRDKTRITVHMTQQFAQDLNLVMASYDISNVSFVVQQSVAAQANAIRDQVAARQKVVHDPDCEKTYHAPGDCGPIPF